jgi:outer membrane receptor protein involved in Fe transport
MLRLAAKPRVVLALALACFSTAITGTTTFAQTSSVVGTVRDETGAVLPGVSIEVRERTLKTAVTDGKGNYRIEGLAPGPHQLFFSLINFGTLRRDVTIAAAGPARADVVMHLAMNADVTVTGKRTFANLADVDNPTESLVGIAQSASQGAITAQQLDERPLMRTGEVLETVPGVVVTQHSGEGKANQYFLRGFNLDHGTDLEQTVAGMPVNMPSHAHGQGYSDLNFMIPELVTGVQFSKGPYYADQGDFATAGASNINYANELDKPIATVEIGGEGYERALFAASPKLGAGHLIAAFELGHDNGPWVNPDAYKKINGVLRYSHGDSVNGFSLTAMGYHGQWNSTDQVPDRAIADGLISRFGAIDPSDGGHSYRYSVSGDWQHGTSNALMKITAYGIGYDLDLFSNFTYYLHDPVHGDQVEQADHRFISGVKVSERTHNHWGGKDVQNTFGIQLRNDDITNVGLYHTEARVRLDMRSQAAVVETLGGIYAQNEIAWTPWLRSLVGLRGDAGRFDVDDELKAYGNNNGGTTSAQIVSPKGGLTFGPWKGTEFYVNAGEGFHSNDARGTTSTLDADGNPISTVTPLVKAKGAEVGVRTVAIPHLQTTVTLWTLHLASELVYDADEGTTEPSRPSARHGVEVANYYSPCRWLIFDGDVSWSQARFTEYDPAGQYVPEAVGTVISAGAAISNLHGAFGSIRLRYFGPRTLIEDNSVQSKATSLVNLQGGYQIAKGVKVAVDVFNLFNAADSDVDYFYTSRLPGEPLDGVAGIHTHPTLPRTARVNLMLGF